MTSKDKPKDQTVNAKEQGTVKDSSKSGTQARSKAKTGKTSKKPGDADKLKQVQKELQEQKDKYLRLSADFDNFRKRTLKEKIELTKLAGEDIFVRILPVLDDLDRAMKSIEDAGEMEAVKEGIRLIHNKLKEYLNQQGVKEIDAMHQEFNTDVHEAVTQIPAGDDALKGKVVDIIEKGYYLNDKVIRYSKVVIGV
jgi:molecular chaperone GrpE